MSEYTHITHTFEPVFDKHSRIIILGTLPSVKSREQNFYYGHPQNRFWKVLAAITQSDVPQTIQEKQALLLRSHIAVWDVVQECDIIGSSDASIKNVTPTDLKRILAESDIKALFANGKTAAKLYDKFQKNSTDRQIITLPSTSPANAACSLEDLIVKWRAELEKYL